MLHDFFYVQFWPKLSIADEGKLKYWKKTVCSISVYQAQEFHTCTNKQIDKLSLGNPNSYV
jgi:hypothetical protein